MQKELLRNVHHFCPEFTELPWSRLATKTFWVPNVCQEPDSITSSWPHFYCYCSVTKSCLTLCNPWTAAHQDSLSFTTSWSLLKFMSIESVMLSNHLILCHPLLLCLQSFPASGSFPVSWLCIRWPKYWSFSFNNNPSNENSGLIFFRMDWFDLAVQGILKSLL